MRVSPHTFLDTITPLFSRPALDHRSLKYVQLFVQLYVLLFVLLFVQAYVCYTPKTGTSQHWNARFLPTTP